MPYSLMNISYSKAFIIHSYFLVEWVVSMYNLYVEMYIVNENKITEKSAQI